jgi:SAM-dependent methyltransferase
MSTFSREWLALREPADHEARFDFRHHPRVSLAPLATTDIIDLGCGTGSNFRYLAPRLAPTQRWTCIDHDARLLERFGESLRALERSDRDQIAQGDLMLNAGGAGWRATIELRCVDLGAGIDTSVLTEGGLLSASALLDLVSMRWLESVVAACASVDARLLFALSYDGRIECAPADPFDAELRALINQHQRRDKGFGPALGPAATASATQLLEAAGFTVATAASDWRLGPRDTEMQRALIEGWVEAAREIDATAALERWRSRRLEELVDGGLGLTIGHQDLFATRT